MGYDEALAGRIRDLVGDEPNLTEQKMFGGLAFLTTSAMSDLLQSGGSELPWRHSAATRQLCGLSASSSDVTTTPIRLSLHSGRLAVLA